VKRGDRPADAAPIEVTSENGRQALAIPLALPDPMATVVVVEIEGDAVIAQGKPS
jgi:hypothetical protein